MRLPLMCPILGTWPATQARAVDWESNQRLFGSQASAQSPEPHQPRAHLSFLTGTFTLFTFNIMTDVSLSLLSYHVLFSLFSV